MILKTVFTDGSEHLYWNTNTLLGHCTAVVQVNALCHRKSNRVCGVYKGKYMHFDYFEGILPVR